MAKHEAWMHPKFYSELLHQGKIEFRVSGDNAIALNEGRRVFINDQMPVDGAFTEPNDATRKAMDDRSTAILTQAVNFIEKETEVHRSTIRARLSGDQVHELAQTMAKLPPCTISYLRAILKP